ncbi:hypothetical protein AKG34_26285 [Peribacillus butanolivorans]|uniref:hypothetical protein n=1 Tax=Peribacillus butanolivorans TaxID=421767 RepID=UPI0006A6C36B|nr:hypothetical protein [Peribacillus butanolivorans]KON66456.1 hypothetical protein AKG34_26285 [Peribacillus butanolivorans]
MSAILNAVKLRPNEEQAISSERARDYVRAMKLHEELEREKERLYQELNEVEKKEAFTVLSKQFNIPRHVTVREASEIIGITPQMVRRHCADGKLIAQQTLEGSGKWRIETDQLMDKPNWDKFIEKRARIKNQSIKIADQKLEYLDEE